MSKKLFSLIHGENLHLSTTKKVIPAKEFSKMLEGKQVIDSVKEDAELYRQEVVKECEKLKEQAKKEGYEEGFVSWAKEVKNLQQEIQSIRKEYAKMLAPIALKAAQKVVGKALQMSDTLIFDIVSNALKPVTQHKKIVIYVNKGDLRVLEEHREELKALFEEVEVLSLRERDDITSGGCVIETEAGIINARLENQWALLERAFEALLKKPETQEGMPTK